ncbi:MAG: glycosyltransferase family 87 protein [Bacteroidota bacterium]
MKKFILNNYLWIIFLLLVSAGSLTANLINHRFWLADLEVYYKTAERMIDGGELYRGAEDDPYEHYVFKYSPPSTLLFIPLLPFTLTAAKYLYWFILTVIMGAVLYTLKSIFTGKPPSDRLVSGILIIAIIITGTHFFRELELGQVNLLMLGMYIFSLRFMLLKKPAAAGALLALSIFIKPFALIFFPLLLLYGRFREMLYILGFAILYFLLPLIFYSDISVYWGLYASWFQELGIELSSKQELLASGNHTIFSVLARYSPISKITTTETGRYLYQIILLTLIAGLFFYHIYRRKVNDSFERLFIILTAFIPLLAFTSQNAFIFTLPLIVYLLFKFRQVNIYFKLLFILCCLLIGGNIYDLMGRELFDLFWSISVYTWGTMGLIVITFWNWEKTE